MSHLTSNMHNSVNSFNPTADSLLHSVKAEKFALLEEQESEISNWLKLESDSILPPLGSHDSLSLSTTGNAATSSCPRTSGFQDLTSCNPFVGSQSSRITNSRENSFIPAANTHFCSSSVASSTYQNVNSPSMSPSPYSSPYSAPLEEPEILKPLERFPFHPAMTSAQQCFSNSNESSSSTYCSPSYSSYPSYPFSNQIMPPELQHFATPQLFQLFAQFQQIVKQTEEQTSADDKKAKKSSGNQRSAVRKVRQTRPKVVEAKGAVQCLGRNRKKGQQCRNAALMEYIGPRPQYCAEHIELDPRTLYVKCLSTYQREIGDNKGCKEVVLKEFKVCYKHYPDIVAEMVKNRDFETIRRHQERVTELLITLEKEAGAAKKKDGDLYQRKNKLIPKFQDMKKTITNAAESLQLDACSSRRGDVVDVAPLTPEDFLSTQCLPVFDLSDVDAFSSCSDE